MSDYTIIEGHHRVAAACKRGLGDLDVICYFHADVESDPLKEHAVAKRIKLADLLPDAQNRKLRQWFVDDIAANFDFGKWTPPIVRNGREAPDARVGQMYLGVNSKLTQTMTERFRMRLRAQEPAPVAIAALIEAAGFKGISDQPEDGYIHTPGACEWVYRGGLFRRRTGDTPAALADTLKLVKNTYGKTAVAVRPEIIRGFGSFVHRYSEISATDVTKKVSARHPTPVDLITDAKVMREAMRCELHKAMALVIRQDYNVARRSGALEEW